MKKKIVKKIVPVTTNNITIAILNFLWIEGHTAAARINVQGQAYNKIEWDGNADIKEKLAWRPSGSTEGVSDIICPLRTRRGCLFLAIEIKRPGDRLRKAQKEWLQSVTSCGGYVIIVEDFDDFKKQYAEIITPIL